MPSQSRKAKGTAAESAVVGYLREQGWPHAERRALSGNVDKGDIAGVAGVCLEVKSCKTIDLAGWLKEALLEQINAKARVGAVVAKKRGTTNPADWYAVLTFGQLTELLRDAGYGDPHADH
jgi:Holliday junction resolvase